MWVLGPATRAMPAFWLARTVVFGQDKLHAHTVAHAYPLGKYPAQSAFREV